MPRPCMRPKSPGGDDIRGSQTGRHCVMRRNAAHRRGYGVSVSEADPSPTDVPVSRGSWAGVRPDRQNPTGGFYAHRGPLRRFPLAYAVLC